MARIKISFPVDFIFKTKITIRVTDVNYGGHVGNDSILSIMHEVRLQFLKHLGFKSEVDIDENVGLIVADVAVQYKAESFHGDELEIRVAVQDFNKYGFDMLYQLINVRSGSEVAVGKTGIVCVDYTEKHVVPIPKVLLKQIS